MIRRALVFGWPTLLIACLCVGLAASNWLEPGPVVCGAAVSIGLATAMLTDGSRRLAAVSVALAAAGLWWGGMRLEALDRSVLSHRLGERADVVAVATGAARRSRFRVRLPAQVRRFADVSVRENVQLELPLGRAPPQGAVIELSARLVAPRGPETGFDERGWLARQGVHVVLRGESFRIVGRRGGIGGVADRLRVHVASALSLGTSGERRALLAGVVLGADDGLDRGLRDDFKASGLYHLLAVSGQNVAFIIWGALGLAWIAGIPRVTAHLIALAAIASYILAVGWQPSVVRAGVAGALGSLAWLASRPQDRWHFLALGALVLLAWSPATLLEPGFQLSFTAVIAIFVCVPWLDRRLELAPLPFALPRLIRGAVAVSTACGIATAPVLWLDFRRVPVWSVLANALAEPAVGALLGLGLAAALVAPVLPSAAASLSWLAGWAAAWLALCARVVARLPAAQVSSGTVLLCLGVALVVVAALARLPRWRRRAAFTGALGVVAILVAALWALRPPPHWIPPPGLRVTFLDVGQGDAELLEVREGAILVDTGPPEARVERQLRRLGVRSLAAVVVTHPHRDHVGGAAAVLDSLHVGELLDPLQPPRLWPEERAARRTARSHGVPIVAARQGAEYRFGRLRLRVLWPDGGGLSGQDPHDHAVVMLASFGATNVLLTADAESNIVLPLRLGPIEVLKVAHHGSADPGLADELRILRPRIAVIEVGARNDYGHPRAETLAALASAPGLTVYRTDRNGRVVLESDGRALSVRTQRGVGSTG